MVDHDRMIVIPGDISTTDHIRIGIDPGLSGAICILSKAETRREESTVMVAEFHDCPIIKAKGKKAKLDVLGMSAILSRFRDTDAVLNIELVSARPNQGVTSMFNFGYGVGAWHGIAAAFNLHPIAVSPQTWKREYGFIGEDKDAPRLKAIETHPLLNDSLKRKRDQGRADALWIALYGSNEE
jgi:crossover junction endodeoxyribonuclease RuvC